LKGADGLMKSRRRTRTRKFFPSFVVDGQERPPRFPPSTRWSP
jgi:hypothetical protein